MTKLSPREKPQKGNPYSITVQQHVFPSASIARFLDHRGGVEVCDIPRQKVRPVGPGDRIFCAQRAWSHKIELWFCPIEMEFQVLAEQIIAGVTCQIGDQERHVVNRFLSIWYFRSRRRNLEFQWITGNGITGNNFSKEQEDHFDKVGGIFVREGGQFPARDINGIQIQILASRYATEDLANAQWGIIRAQDGEFVVPDSPTLAIVPLTPTLCLVKDAPTGMITRENVADVNRSVIRSSHAYFFARNFAVCPI